MNKTIKNVLIILAIIFVVLTLLFVANKWRQSKCGDNICQRWELNKGTCSADCEGIIEEGLAINPKNTNDVFGLYEIVNFKCSNGKDDPECTKFGTPKWEVSGCGTIQGSNQGSAIVWNTGHGACSGKISVSYNKQEKSVALKTKMPEGRDAGRISTVNLPGLTANQILDICKKEDPYSKNSEFYKKQIVAGQELSKKLEDYIRGWLAGKNPAEIPAGYLGEDIDNAKTNHWKLYKPDEITAEEQWYGIPAREEPDSDNWQHLRMNNAATHVTYQKLIYIAPYDSQLVIEGDFPHARFMSLQVSPPFDPQFPYAGNRGQMEVPLIDADINPDPGNINPFRVGENRNATNRHYHAYFDLKQGNMVDLNPVLQNEYFRAQGNTRVGGPFSSTGAIGNGMLSPAILWLRYYVPDNGKNPYGGVSLPKALFKLKTGEEFWIQPDTSKIDQLLARIVPGYEEKPLAKVPAILGPSMGWWKMFDIFLIWAEGAAIQKAQPFGKLPENTVKKVLQEQYACQTNKGPDAAPPGNIGHSATDCPYDMYLHRSIAVTPNHVYAITGRIPTTPKTRNGESTTQKTQARYWSICHTGGGQDDMYNGLVYGCLLDENVVRDNNNDYIIVYGQKEKPSNARPECGITWQNIGPESTQGLIMRWMNVYPDNYMKEYAPTDQNIPWKTGSWYQTTYNKSLIGENKSNVMGPYQPIVHYQTIQEFEALGCPVDKNKIIEWK